MALTTDILLTPADWEFVKTLTKVGYVTVLTSQVKILFPDRSGIGSNKDNKLHFPEHWHLEGVYYQGGEHSDHGYVCMLWGVK